MGGGWTSRNTPGAAENVGYNEPDSDGAGWHVIMGNGDPNNGFDFEALARCAAQQRIRAAVAPRAVHATISHELAAMRARIRR